jgi:hypothetical protein
MKLKVFSLLYLLAVIASAERESLVSEEVYLRIKDCIHAINYTPVKWSDSNRASLREKAFAGLTDQEKIRALAEWMFRRPHPTHIDAVSGAGQLLIAPEPVIRDYSEFRRLMAVETDSRRFFQLSVLAPSYDESNDHDFMVDRARGLFLEGVAADLGQSTCGHPLNSISAFTFSFIAEQLRGESAEFKSVVYPKLVSMESAERKLELAKWLKANWPGCEDLALPVTITSKDIPHSSPSNPPDDGPKPAATSTPETRPKQREVPKASLNDQNAPWWQIGAGLALLLVAIIVLRKVRGRPA